MTLQVSDRFQALALQAGVKDLLTKGHTPEEVVEFDPSYIQWLYNEVKPRVCSKSLAVSVEQSNEERDSQDDWRRDVPF